MIVKKAALVQISAHTICTCDAPFQLALVGLEYLRRRHLELRAEHPVPKPAADAEAILVIRKVMLEMVLLQLSPIRRQIAVVQEVVRHVVQHIAKYTAAVSDQSGVPVVEENKMGKLPERCREDCEECRWHDQAVFVHRKVVVNTMEKEVRSNANTVVGKIAGPS